MNHTFPDSIAVEAKLILRRSLGISIFLGLFVGLLFGYELLRLLPGNIELISILIFNVLLGKFASISVGIIIVLTMVVSHRFLMMTHAEPPDPRLGVQIAAGVWASLLCYCVFALAALAGFLAGASAGVTTYGPALVEEVLRRYELFAHLARALLRLVVQGVWLGWISQLELIVMAGPEGRAPIRVLGGAGLLAIEGLDSYLFYLLR
ncbi:MAG: hypothetical protein MO847_01825 [Candidatus Protistobacter heckmanni]|nr:hypothetical protein [Candidatus Protistobacter heckmanni]